MGKKIIVLDFGSLVLEADMFDSIVADGFIKNLPYTTALQKWGSELYGSIGIDLGEEKPVSTIPSGGIAYTNNGNYVCIFWGQTPAWPVEYIGQIKGETWKKLVENPSHGSVTIRLKQ